jgi:hypothetical protein
MPSPHDTLFPDDLDRVARWRREAEEHEREFARQRAREERVQQSKVQTMDSDTQSKWDAWADGRIEVAWRHHMDVVGDALGETMQKFDAKIAQVRQEMRDSPPLFSAPDKKLSAAMVRLGDSLHATSEGIEALRTTVGECAKRSDLGSLRLRLEKQIAELEERIESNAAATEKNLRSVNTMVFNLSQAIERLHCLVARVAVASENANALRAVDEHKLANEEKPSATVLSLADLRYAQSA